MVALRQQPQPDRPARLVLIDETPPGFLLKPRRDALPEHTQYIDGGCDLHPSCLTCPLVRCRYDEPGGARKLRSDERDRAILRLHRQGSLKVEAVARSFGVSRRTVFRVLARARQEVQA
jgi:hypothetical protein